MKWLPMASAQTRKRARADDLSQEHRPHKKIKRRLHKPSNFPPEFWDNLSKVPLTRRALRELDRRNGARPGLNPEAPAAHVTKDLARFARHGGPDLRYLRGYPEPKSAVHNMASSRATSSSQRTKSTSAYDDAFEQHMIDNSIYPPFHDFPDNRPTPKPNNLSEDRQVLSTGRSSFSLSHFTETAFEDFQRKNRTASESTIKRNVIPIIAGNSDIPNDGDLMFTNIEPITGGRVVKAMPDFFDGVRVGDIHDKIRNADEESNLNKLIIPTKHASAPVAPNFFLETKAPKGGTDVALRQALYDGAIGARAMHALRNYGEEEPVYSGDADSYSSTYHAGQLNLYAHHVTPPTAPGGQPEYHMTLLDSYSMMGKRERFIEGATAFRNARDLAHRRRVGIIQAANAIARQAGTEAPPEAAELQAVGTESCAASQDVGEGLALPGQLHQEDEEPSQQSTSFGTEPAMRFTAQSQTSSKRNRASHSPPSNSQPHKKHNSEKMTRFNEP